MTRKALKWDNKKRDYDEVDISERCSLIASMETVVECPGCGKMFPFGESYTSRIFHTSLGFGYGVCWDCYQKEEA